MLWGFKDEDYLLLPLLTKAKVFPIQVLCPSPNGKNIKPEGLTIINNSKITLCKLSPCNPQKLMETNNECILIVQHAYGLEMLALNYYLKCTQLSERSFSNLIERGSYFPCMKGFSCVKFKSILYSSALLFEMLLTTYYPREVTHFLFSGLKRSGSNTSGLSKYSGKLPISERSG